MESEKVGRWIGRIYEAVLEPELWREALDELAAQVGADGWHFVGWDSERSTDVTRLSADVVVIPKTLIDQYDSHYGALDPRRDLAARTEVGAVVSCHRHFDHRFRSRSEFFQDYLLPAGFCYSMGASLHRNATLDYQLGLVRTRDRPPFGLAAEELFAATLPHLGRALRLANRAGTQALERAATAKGLDAASLAVIAMDAAARPRYCNRQAEAPLRSGVPLAVRQGRVICTASERQSAWSAAIQATLRSRRPSNLLLSNDDTPPARHSLTLTLLSTGTILEGDGVLCLAAPLDGLRIATAKQLIELFGLTPAEARLARAVASGSTLGAYAEAQGLQATTVKTQLRQVLAKTGAARQSALVRVVGAVAAVRES